MKAILGKKVGMTQIFSPEGKAIPVTVIEAGPCSLTGTVKEFLKAKPRVLFFTQTPWQTLTMRLMMPPVNGWKNTGTRNFEFYEEKAVSEKIPLFSMTIN